LELPAITLLFGVRLADDDVECEAPAGQLVEGRHLAGEQGGRDEPRPVRDQIGHSRSPRGRVHGDQEPLGGRG
jgi:hypothetical protein